MHSLDGSHMDTVYLFGSRVAATFGHMFSIPCLIPSLSKRLCRCYFDKLHSSAPFGEKDLWTAANNQKICTVLYLAPGFIPPYFG